MKKKTDRIETKGKKNELAKSVKDLLEDLAKAKENVKKK